MIRYVPTTPLDTPLVELWSDTEEHAWEKLMTAIPHMPYKTVDEFKARGYKVERWEPRE